MKSLLACVLLASSIGVGPGLASPASALSCVGPSRVLADAPRIYAGRIVASADGEVTLAVDEVWKGTPPPARVHLDVDLGEWWDDQLARDHARVVVAPADRAVNPCTVFVLTGPEAADVTSFRPASPAAPVPGRDDLDVTAPSVQVDHTWTWLVAGAGGGVLLVGSLWWVLRRRRA